MRCFVAEALSWTVVESILSECDLFFRYFFEPSVLWKELADQAIQVLVCAAFPRSMGMREVILQAKFGCDLLMQRKLFAVVGGQRMRQMREGVQLLNDGIPHICGLFSRHSVQQRVAAFALVDGYQRLRVPRSDDQIRLPVADT